MTQFLYANNAATTLAGPIAATATTVNLAAGTGALFPSPGAGQQFSLTFISAGNPNIIEIAYCTSRSGDVCTITRGQEGTAARAFIAGDEANNDLTAATCAAFIQASQLQQQATNYAVDTGPVNAIQVALTPQPGSLALIAGSPIRVLVGHTNTGNATLTISGLPTTSVFAQGGATNSLAAGSLIVGQIYEFTYVPSVGFEVSTAKVLLSTANTWAGAQTIANNVFWSGANTGGASQALLGVDSSNNTAMVAGPSGSIAWRVLNNALTATLLYLGAAGGLHAVGGIFADTGDLNTMANVNAGGNAIIGGNAAVTGTVSGNTLTSITNIVAGNLLRATHGATGTNDANAATVLADFVSAPVSGNNIYFTIPALGLGSNNNVIVQLGEVNVTANNTPAIFNLPRSFPAVFAGIVISYAASLPPSGATVGAIGAEPIGGGNLSQFRATNTATGGIVNGCFFIAIGW